MSIFVTSLGATDNELCAPICHSILNQMSPKGFKFRGIPAVEPQIILEKNQVSFTLSSCYLKTTPIIFDFSEADLFLEIYRQEKKVSKELQMQVKKKIDELEKLATGDCVHSKSCADCVMTLVNRNLFL